MPRTARHGKRPALTLCAGLVVVAVGVLAGTLVAVEVDVTDLVGAARPDGEPASAGTDPTGVDASGDPMRPEIPPTVVEGDAVVAAVVELRIDGSGLFADGSDEDVPEPVDDGAVDRAVEDVRGWLDVHLTDLAAGTADDLDDVLRPRGTAEMTETLEPSSDHRAVPGEGADGWPPQGPVAATYELTVAAQGSEVAWVDADVAVRDDERTHRWRFVLAIEAGVVTPLAVEALS